MARRSIVFDDYVGPLLASVATLPPEVPQLEEQALDRILAKVGEKFIPADFNRIAILRAIQKAVATSENIRRSRDRSRGRAITNMKRIHKHAKALSTLLVKDDDANRLIASEMPLIRRDVFYLSVISKVFSQNRSKPAKDGPARHPRRPSINEWLAGVELPLVFQDCFRRKVGRSRINRRSGGPTVEFVAAVMLEMRLPHKPETIARAITRFSELREVRRAIRNRDPDVGQK